MTHPPLPSHDFAVRARDAFLVIAEAPADARHAMLLDLRNEDPALARRVEIMLAGDAESDAPGALPLDEPLINVRAVLSEEVIDDDVPGAPLDLPDLAPRYMVRRLIGCGSAGDVYLAREQAPMVRDVAIKLFRPFRVGTVRRKRFETEARALATLEHPGIARIFDTGTSSDGRPYLVMELAPGLPFDEACDGAGLDLHGRLRMLARLCRIVHHAHQRGVIHRDLKPRNILACCATAEYSIKVIDFGLARLAEEAGLPSQQRTMTGQLLGTLDYMSPEQLRGAPADARSDVYALGVLLVQVLTGRLPSRNGNVVREGPTSSTLPTMPELPARYRRDIETLAARALAADPKDRFPSAEHLADEIDRVLHGVPILTRRTTLRERFVRFVRRSPGTATLAALLVSTCLLLLTTIVLSRHRLAAESDRQRDVIERMLDDVLEELESASGSTPMRRRLVPPLVDHARGLHAARPDELRITELLARLLVLHGNMIFETGHRDDAVTAFEEAATIFETLAGTAESTIEMRRRAAVAIIRIGDTYGYSDPIDAYPYYERALKLHEALAREHPSHIGILDDLSWSHHRLGMMWLKVADFDRANLHLIRHKQSATDLLQLDPSRIMSRFNMMSAHSAMGSLARARSDYRTGAEAFQRSIVIGRQTADDDPDRLHIALHLLIALANLTSCLAELGEHDNTAAAFDELLQHARQVLHGNPDNSFVAINVFSAYLNAGEAAVKLNDAERASMLVRLARHALPHTGIELHGSTLTRWNELVARTSALTGE